MSALAMTERPIQLVETRSTLLFAVYIRDTRHAWNKAQRETTFDNIPLALEFISDCLKEDIHKGVLGHSEYTIKVEDA